MDWLVAKPLFYRPEGDNETEYENVKFKDRLNKTLRDDAVSKMAYPLLNKRPSFKL